MAQEELSLRRLRTWLRLLRLTRSTESRLRDFLRVNFDTTLPRFDVAAALYRQDEPMKMSELSRMLLVSNGNATNVVDRLEQEGKVHRVSRESDKRVVLVELTPSGRDWFREISAAHEQEVNRIFANLGHDELTQLRDLIRIAERAQDDHR
ncbi:MarR family transcriptional regulator [Aestuariicoccus sp. MJ-SS9]|uniref:MarR family winged helix-turn-helix transcriptional regulator n=1 Tax=Aestuariicoccus sp. MJ-SS9 TaxID=3079855 RepID=UPI00290D5D19|nr:MarR family transcriptional regulator [Aestuariicoccus sp. MJ-SS9]MDU8912541.1 MarR family transcriptional regulator [Aestuariicoccus sp. MJ-SS9]